VDAVWYLDPRAKQAITEVPVAIVNYDPVTHVVKGMLRTRNELESYIRFADRIPLSQLGAGWSGTPEDARRSISSQADMTLYRPAASKQLEIVGYGTANVTVLEDGRSLGTRAFSGTGVQTLRWDLDDAGAGDKKITIETHDRPIAVAALGYVSP